MTLTNDDAFSVDADSIESDDSSNLYFRKGDEDVAVVSRLTFSHASREQPEKVKAPGVNETISDVAKQIGDALRQGWITNINVEPALTEDAALAFNRVFVGRTTSAPTIT